MKHRCNDPNDKDYLNYGGRGIRVCAEWVDSFEAFFAAVGERPTPRHTLDRYPNNDGNYEPGNVRWATPQEQSRNNRNTVLLTFDGRTMCLSDWAKELGIHPVSLAKRLRRWPIDKAMTLGRAQSESLQAARRHKRDGLTSRFKGVARKGNKFSAQIKVLGKARWLGVFENEEAAARAYDHAANEIYGTDAVLSFPLEASCEA